MPLYKLTKPDSVPDGGRGLDVVTGGCGPSVTGGLVVTLSFKRRQLILSKIYQKSGLIQVRCFIEFYLCIQ